jgi:aconitate hydratase
VKNDPAHTDIGSTIFANMPGDGSAREQAASCQRVMGASANFAKQYATKRYRSNCINWGMTPFLVENPEVFELGDYIFVPGIREAVLENKASFTAYAVKPDGTVTSRSPPVPSPSRSVRSSPTAASSTTIGTTSKQPFSQRMVQDWI